MPGALASGSTTGRIASRGQHLEARLHSSFSDPSPRRNSVATSERGVVREMQTSLAQESSENGGVGCLASLSPRLAAAGSAVGEMLETPAAHFIILSVVGVNLTCVIGETMLREVCPAVTSTDFNATSWEEERLETTHTALGWISRAILLALFAEAMLVAVAARMRFGTTSSEGALLIFLLVWRIVRIIHGVIGMVHSIRRHSVAVYTAVVEQLDEKIVRSPKKQHCKNRFTNDEERVQVATCADIGINSTMSASNQPDEQNCSIEGHTNPRNESRETSPASSMELQGLGVVFEGSDS